MIKFCIAYSASVTSTTHAYVRARVALSLPYSACAIFTVAVGVKLITIRYARSMEKEKVIEESDPILGRPGYGVQSPSPPYHESDERQKCRVYPGRFYVLMVLAFLALHQNVAWMTFGTIPNESYQHFGLTDDDVTLIAGKKK